MLLDFSNHKFVVPPISNEWEQEIVDFILEFQENDQIIVKTSGSTGVPKEMVLPKEAMISSAQMTAEFLEIKKGDSALLCMPVRYIAGKMMLVRAMEMELKLYCVEPKTKIEINHPIDFVAMTPMQAEMSFFPSKIKGNNLKIKKLILGGAKVTKALEEKFKGLKTQVYETYGMTETITHIAMRELNYQTSFHVMNNIKIHQDERGCLVIKTPYFEEKIITNDVVEIFDDHSFNILGRVDNVINSGGIKVNPESIEEILSPYISKPFVVHYKKDEILGQQLILVVESQQPVEINFPKDLIPKNQHPKQVAFIPEFPRTISGKVIRKDLDLYL